MSKAKSTPQVPNKFEPVHGVTVYEYFITNYLIRWYQGKSVSSHVYERAMKELDVLKKRKAVKNSNKDNIVSVTEQNIDSEREKEEVKCLGNRPSSAGTTHQIRGQKIPPRQESIAGSRNRDLENKLQRKIEGLQARLADTYVELNKKESLLNRTSEDLRNCREEVNELKMRLSKLAGDKLRDNNPDLADLSDPNRPTELGKRFSEIYDNEWSDAFENIARKTEAEKSSYQYCDEIFRKQIPEIRGILLQDSMNPSSNEARKTVKTEHIHNSLKEMRKRFASQTAGNVAQNFEQEHLELLLEGFHMQPKEVHDSLRKYARKCAEICWFMVVCDPPMVLSEDKEGMNFNTDVYKPYTRSIRDVKNPVVELHVWPALHLHYNGPLVAKGVAQPNAK